MAEWVNVCETSSPATSAPFAEGGDSDAAAATCCVCFDVGAEVLEGCSSKSAVCSACRLGTITAALEDVQLYFNSKGLVRCPCTDRDCPAVMSNDVALEALKARIDLRNLYLHLSRKVLVERNPDTRFCPANGCDGIVHNSEGAWRVACGECHATMCWRCGTAHHPLVSCSLAAGAAFHAWRREVAANAEGVRRCPSCKEYVEKNGGCPHMSCRCGYQFCWHCRSKWRSGCGNPLCPLAKIWSAKEWGRTAPTRAVTHFLALPVGAAGLGVVAGLAVAAGALGLAAGALFVPAFAVYAAQRAVREALERRRLDAGIGAAGDGRMDVSQALVRGVYVLVPYTAAAREFRLFTQGTVFSHGHTVTNDSDRVVMHTVYTSGEGGLDALLYIVPLDGADAEVDDTAPEMERILQEQTRQKLELLHAVAGTRGGDSSEDRPRVLTAVAGAGLGMGTAQAEVPEEPAEGLDEFALQLRQAVGDVARAAASRIGA